MKTLPDSYRTVADHRLDLRSLKNHYSILVFVHIPTRRAVAFECGFLPFDFWLDHLAAATILARIRSTRIECQKQKCSFFFFYFLYLTNMCLAFFPNVAGFALTVVHISLPHINACSVILTGIVIQTFVRVIRLQILEKLLFK